MIWSNGYSASIYMTTVDPASWRDLDRIEITGGKVSRSCDGLMGAASVDCVNYDQTTERWVRIWMGTRQEGAADHVALFTGLATSPGRDINGELFTNAVDCYSVLKPAEDVLLPRGWYAPAGWNGAMLIAQMLEATPAPVERESNSPTLKSDIIAEAGETNLSMAKKILEAINWRLRITGDGVIQVIPKATEESAVFDALDHDAVEPELSTTYDWFACPNVFRATQGDQSAVARDDRTDSIFSTVSRGREIWQSEDSVNLADNESLDMYAARRLTELQNVVYSVSYDRRYHPEVMAGDLVRLHYPKQSLDGLFRVTSQSIDLEKNGRTSEGCEKI